MNGSIDNRDCKLEFDQQPEGELDEVEFKDLTGPKSLENITNISITAVPHHVGKTMNVFLADDATPVQNSRACSAMINRENAHRIDARTAAFKNDEITDSGRLIDFEKE